MAKLNAFSEVENALGAESLLREREQHLAASARESQEAEALADKRYQEGLADIITVLEAQRRAFNARSQLLSVRNLRLNNRIDLYLALGGPFSTHPEGTFAATPGRNDQP